MVRASIELYKKAYTGLSPEIWWLALVIFVNRCGTMVIPFLTVYLTSRGFTLLQAGYIMGAFGLGAIAGGFIGGRLTDKWGFHIVQFWSLLLNGIMFIILGEMQTFTQFAVCIFVLSTLGESFRPANAAAIAAYTDDSNRTRGYSLNRLAINLGWSIGPAIGGILASINYHLLFWADGITCMLASVILYHYLKPGEKGQVSKKEVVKEKGSSAYKDGVFLQGMFYVFLIGLCFFQLFSLLPLFYKDQLHLNEAMIGALIAGNGLIIVVFEMILVYKLERLGKVIHYIMIGSFLIGLSFLTLNLAPWVSVAILSMAMVSFGEMLLFPFINNFWVNRSSEQNRGQYAAVFAISFAAANVLAPTLSMYLAEKSSFALVWVVDFFICTFAALGFYLLKKQIA